MVTFRVRENTRDIKGAPGHADFKGYWIYCSNEFHDYYEALMFAVDYDRTHQVGCWVELIEDYIIYAR